jgi:hypothetical protein
LAGGTALIRRFSRDAKEIYQVFGVTREEGNVIHAETRNKAKVRGAIPTCDPRRHALDTTLVSP